MEQYPVMTNENPQGITIDIVSASSNVTALAFVTMIAVSVHRNRNSHKAFLLKFLIYVDIGAAMVQLVCAVINIPFRRMYGHDESPELSTFMIVLWAYIIQILCVLGTLMTRYHVSFQDSMFAISECTQIMFIVVALVLTICLGVGVICTVYLVIDGTTGAIEDGIWWERVGISAMVLIGTYILCGSGVVFRFCRNLLCLAKLRQRTKPMDLTNYVIELDQSQKSLVRTISKYVTLFTLATLSTFTTGIICGLLARQTSLWPKEHSSQSAVMSIDCVVNVSCLFLQYNFSGKMYRKYCSNIDAFCRNGLSANLIESMSPKAPKEDIPSSTPSSVIESHGQVDSDSLTNDLEMCELEKK